MHQHTATKRLLRDDSGVRMVARVASIACLAVASGAAQDATTAAPTPAAPAWTIFRGDPGLTGKKVWTKSDGGVVAPYYLPSRTQRVNVDIEP